MRFDDFNYEAFNKVVVPPPEEFRDYSIHDYESMGSFRSNLHSEDDAQDSDGAQSVVSHRGKKKRRRRKGKWY